MQNSLIMLVDDNDTDNFMNKRILELNGFGSHIIIKNSGHYALEYLKENSHNIVKIPDLILLDINMPVVDGLQFLYAYEDLNIRIKSKCSVVILTSSGSHYDLQRFTRDENVKEYIIKPLRSENLNTLKNILYSKRNTQAIKNSSNQ